MFDANKTYRVGAVAEQLHVSESTIRHWDEVGKLRSERDTNGFRYYRGDQLNDYLSLRKREGHIKRKVAYVRSKCYEEIAGMEEQYVLIDQASKRSHFDIETYTDVDMVTETGKPEAFYKILQGIISRNVDGLILYDKECLDGIISYEGLDIIARKFGVNIYFMKK